MTPQSIQKALQKRREEHAFRSLSPSGKLTDFCSNDFLGLAQTTDITQNSIRHFSGRTGSTGSRLISGHSEEIGLLENELSEIFRAEAALLFNSGYNANLGLLSSVPTRGDTILYDEQSHASIKDGVRLSLAKSFPFRHNDAADLRRRLSSAEGTCFVVVEAAYSMSGAYCAIHEIVEVCKSFNAYLIVDEAHTTGMYGKGAGWCVEQGVHQHVFARVMTFGKAVGVFGAAVVGSRDLIDFLINFSRPFIYTTALPPFVVQSIREAFRYIKAHPELSDALFEKARRFSAQLGGVSSSPIQAINVSGNEEVKAAALQLRNEGFDVRPILSPTVKKGEEMLRICLHTFNTDDEIDWLAEAIRKT